MIENPREERRIAMEGKTKESRAAERRPLKAAVEFIVDGDIEMATSVDVSETGIRFDTSKPMKVRMRFDMGHRKKEFVALLVWARRNADETMAYGFEFIPDEDNGVF